MGVPATAALWDGGGPATEDQHDGVAIEVEGLTKRYGDATVVDDLTFSVRPGRVTGFLGPNGAGKSTTMQMLLGLATPTEGRATIGDRTYADLDDPVRTVGALLEANAFHPGRSGRNGCCRPPPIARTYPGGSMPTRCRTATV
ncbi:MAG TPA: ATP-binding cassette domain-containing protein, partial [Acidimicrobiales bacterium]|nr:ATP-binding cassette domain-containing protein [Acidimicrobiales bacterium]